ncbi:hypothetical protein GCM10009665_61210 [Kitasatospora nipponensis]|uniref:Uncharacterized protein n=1 Tax=Kitasatospora nipponensis TaxID=258049 RepID=A0ABN1WVY8_9ACTN
MSVEGNVEFEKILPADLRRLPVTAQALDNQWLTAGELRGVWSGGRSRRAALREQGARVRTEYLRALVTADQVVVNRAYLYNNPVISQDYLAKAAGRDAFRQLLDDGVLVPFLWNEATPVQEPAFGLRDLEEVWPAWTAVAQECRMTCLSLDWDGAGEGAGAAGAADRLGSAFARYVQGLEQVDLPALARTLGVPPAGEQPLHERLRQVADFGRAQVEATGLVSRDALYRTFVVAPGSNPAERSYDPARAFGAEIKQVVDLAYNVNLADRLGAYALTPHDSLPRTALQEWQLAPRAAGPELSADHLVEVVRRTAFDILQEGLYVESFGQLTLDDVVALRQSAGWQQYQGAFQALLAAPDLADPQRFADPEHGAPAVVGGYVAMLREASDRAAGRRVGAAMARWTPTAELFIEVATGLVRIALGSVPFFEVISEVGKHFVKRAVPVSIRLVVGRGPGGREHARLGTGLRVVEGRFADDGRAQWESLITRLRSAGFAEHRGLGPGTHPAQLNGRDGAP